MSSRRDKNVKLEPLRQSTSQPDGRSKRERVAGAGERDRDTHKPLAQSHSEPIDFDTRSPAYENVRQPYDAVTDPYCPYTRTGTFKKHMKGRKKLDKLSKTEGNKMSKSQSQPFGMITTMKNMDRPISAPEKEMIPRHQVHNTNAATSGVTISAEPSGNAAEGQAELEILKAILNREGYLVRLYKVVRTIQKKFKPEIADIIDLVRTATVDVVEAIEKWRSIKVCVVSCHVMLLFTVCLFLNYLWLLLHL